MVAGSGRLCWSARGVGLSAVPQYAQCTKPSLHIVPQAGHCIIITSVTGRRRIYVIIPLCHRKRRPRP